MNFIDKQKIYKVILTTLTATLFLPIAVDHIYAEATSQAKTIEKPDAGEQRVIVTYKNNISEDAKDQIENTGDVQQSFKHVNAVSLEVSNTEMKALESNPNVTTVENDDIVKIKETSSQIIPYGINSLNGIKSWESGLTGKGVKVAIIDSGAAIHSDLNIAGGKSFVSYTTSYIDDNGHGTHVAGIVGAKNNSFGVVGIAPDSDLYVLKALDSTGTGYNSDIIKAIDWSIENHMNIINMSLGGSDESYAFQQAIDKAYNSGILVIAAAGNDGAPVEYPAKYNHAIAVSATDSSNNLAYFSNRGPEIEVAAPGVNVISTYKGNTYASMDGTSMATPYVAGVLALYKQEYPNATPDDIRNMVHQNAIDLGAPGRDSSYGYGLIQAPIMNSRSSIATPTNFKALNVTSDTATLSWNSTSEATSYKLTRNGVTVYEGLNTTYNDTALTPHTYYQYKLYAVKNSALSPTPATTGIITYPLTPPSPANFKATNVTGNSVSLNWSTSNYATFYELKRNGVMIYKGSNLSYTDTSTKPNTSYDYQVIAGNYGSSSSPSQIKVTTLQTTPLNAYTFSTYSSYKKGSTVLIGVYSRYNGNISVPWARFDIVVKSPTGTIYKNTHYTNQNGVYTISVPTSWKSPSGKYTISVLMSKAGFLGISKTASFYVN
ncbi:S8 family serine peptidase [Priestia megaterium]|uniref:S8 family serine peptidase n=1 Tax=Priestia megaterium TaxID=1404 RepID=UPI002E1EA9DF|nr:S8 family serine peptidase [Priestia megaterium]MED4284795.1 S8 family serine peptidase [Priestia megaterium]